MHLHISLRKSLLGDIMTGKSFNTVPVDGTICTDASLNVWGMWSKQEQKLYINELLEVKLGLLSFFKDNRHYAH